MEIPLGKIGQPEDVASMAIYLASDASSTPREAPSSSTAA